MQKLILSTLSTLALIATLAAPAAPEDIDQMAGKWSVQKTSDDGQRITQQLEITKNKFAFQIKGPDAQTRLYAQGEVKLGKSGPFKTITFTNIQAGLSADAVDSIDDTYTSIYSFGEDDTFLVVMNFDKERDEQKPSLDAYRKMKQAKK